MATGISREAYFETGLEVLSESGHGGLKLAEVCNRLGVTTGSFYHYFPNWPSYTRALIDHWLEGHTLRVVERVRAEPEPHRRIDISIQIGLDLPHGAESAIRSWSCTDSDVRAIQMQADRQRFEVLRESAYAILQHPRRAELFASSAMYLLVGYEQSTLPRDKQALAWGAELLRSILDGRRFADAPEP